MILIILRSFNFYENTFVKIFNISSNLESNTKSITFKIKNSHSGCYNKRIWIVNHVFSLTTNNWYFHRADNFIILLCFAKTTEMKWKLNCGSNTTDDTFQFDHLLQRFMLSAYKRVLSEHIHHAPQHHALVENY